MLRFALSRIGMAIPTLLIVAVAVFVIVRLIPGDPAALMLGDSADAATLAALREQLGLNHSIFTQFLIWGGNVLHGDLGVSIANQQPVLALVLERFSVSARIVLSAVVLSTFVAVPLGMIAAWKQNSLTDLTLVTCATLLLSVPAFWMGLLLLLAFGLKLGWLPIVGYVSFGENPWKAFLYLVLPVTTLFLHEIGVILRMARASTLEVLNLDYITHARAKGLSEATVMWRHAFRNAFGPTRTLLGLILGNLLGGIAVVETVLQFTDLAGFSSMRSLPAIIRHSGLSAVHSLRLCAGQSDRGSSVSVLRPEGDGEMKNLSLNALIGGTLTATLLTVAVVGSFWTPYNPLSLDFAARLAPPNAAHWLGTDEFGRDQLSRLMQGASASVSISVFTVFLATLGGVLIGAISGFLRGWFDRLLMMVNDALLAFPGILMALGLLAVFGANKNGIILALALAYMSSVIRVVRGTVLSLREREFVEASRVMGNSEIYTMVRHILPNCLAPVLVMATSMCGWAILAESSLSFLGTGVPPPAPTWGNMLAGSRNFIEQAVWLGIFPGLAISLSLLGINLLGDALRDRLDPRMRKRS